MPNQALAPVSGWYLPHHLFEYRIERQFTVETSIFENPLYRLFLQLRVSQLALHLILLAQHQHGGTPNTAESTRTLPGKRKWGNGIA